MRFILQNEERNRTIFIAIIILLISLFVSRAFLSVSLILFLIVTTLHKDFLSQLNNFLRNPLLVSISLLFLIPLLSGIWSEDWRAWLNILKIKLPFLFLPVAFAGAWQLSEKQWKIITYSFLSLVIISCCWSIGQYFLDKEAINESYLRAKTIPTVLYNDHVRFSWLVSIAVLFNSLLIYQSEKKKIKLLLCIPLVFMVIYLHLLAARTGLLSIYIFFLCFFNFLTARKKKYSAFIIAGIALTVAASWIFFPTFRNRIKYVRYDFSFVKNENTPGTSDANRLISLKAGWNILQSNPFGVGAGDIWNEVNKWYEANVPGMKEQDKLFPSSEWIVYGDMAGWPAVLLFTAIVVFPFFVNKIRYRFFWSMLIVILIAGFVAETTLEIQFGIFIYCFTTLCYWKWLKI